MYAENIRKLREHCGLTQEEFGSKVGVSVGVITNLELARLKRPESKMPLFQLIADTFGVPVEWILSDNPAPLPPLDERGKQARMLGEMADDPVVQSFAEFWSARTDAEKKTLLKAMDDFIEILKRNQTE